MPRKIVLAGGSGFLGRALAADLAREDVDILILTRSPRDRRPHGWDVLWDGESPGPWEAALDGAAAVVNFTGRSVDCRYTAANRRAIVESRVKSVAAIGDAIRRCEAPPPVWVQASSLAIYGDAGDRICDENAPHGEGFSVDVCERWEAELERQRVPETRKCVLRIGFALGSGGGTLERLARLARLGLGGTIGSGRQYISWLHVADLNRMIRRAIERPEVSGTFNATGPAPIRNRNFMRAVRQALGRPWSPPVPAPAVRIGAFLMGTEPELALTGRRCVPARFLAQGFSFEHPRLDTALQDLLAQPQLPSLLSRRRQVL